MRSAKSHRLVARSMINNSMPVRLAQIDRHRPRPEPLHGQTGQLPESSRIFAHHTLNQAIRRVEAERYRRAKGEL